MNVPDTQRRKEATERLQKLATANVTKEREEQPCDVQEHLQKEHQSTGTIQLQCKHLCRPAIFTSWGKTLTAQVCQPLRAFEELHPITVIALSSLGMLPFGPL